MKKKKWTQIPPIGLLSWSWMVFAISFIFSVAPCSSGYVHANTALQRCLITASWVPEMQMEGRPWSCMVSHCCMREGTHLLPSTHPLLEEEI